MLVDDWLIAACLYSSLFLATLTPSSSNIAKQSTILAQFGRVGIRAGSEYHLESLDGSEIGQIT